MTWLEFLRSKVTEHTVGHNSRINGLIMSNFQINVSLEEIMRWRHSICKMSKVNFNVISQCYSETLWKPHNSGTEGIQGYDHEVLNLVLSSYHLCKGLLSLSATSLFVMPWRHRWCCLIDSVAKAADCCFVVIRDHHCNVPQTEPKHVLLLML